MLTSQRYGHALSIAYEDGYLGYVFDLDKYRDVCGEMSKEQMEGAKAIYQQGMEDVNGRLAAEQNEDSP